MSCEPVSAVRARRSPRQKCIRLEGAEFTPGHTKVSV